MPMIYAVYLPNSAPSSSPSILFGARPPDGVAVDERRVGTELLSALGPTLSPAATNLRAGGMDEADAMKVTGHQTAHVFRH